mgnify:FL=1
MTYFPQNQNGQAANANSAPVTISSDQISSNKLASDESLALLRRIVKLLESNAVVDGQNRQRMTIDSISSVTLPTVSTVGQVTTVGNMTTMAGQNQQMFADVARNTYATGIRSKLNWT